MPRRNRLGHRVQSQSPHLFGQGQLGIRIQPQPEQPFRRLPGALAVSQPFGQLQRGQLAALQHLLVARRDRVHDLQGLFEILPQDVQRRQFELQIGLLGQAPVDVAEQRHRFVLLVHPPQRRAQQHLLVQHPVVVSPLQTLPQVRDQFAARVVALKDVVHCPQQQQGAVVDVGIGIREIDLDSGIPPFSPVAEMYGARPGWPGGGSRSGAAAGHAPPAAAGSGRLPRPTRRPERPGSAPVLPQVPRCRSSWPTWTG
jgi:hypothetical protein